MSNSAEDDIPLPSLPVLSEEESIRQIRADMARVYIEELKRLLIDLDCITYHAVEGKWQGIPALCKQAKWSIKRALMQHQAESPEMQRHYADIIKENPEL